MIRCRATKSFTIDCAHNLSGVVEPAHKCARPHGHTYTITVVVSQPWDTLGHWIVDFGDIKQVVAEKYDHRDLNTVFANGLPTTVEVFAGLIWEDIERLLLAENRYEPGDAGTARVESVAVQEGQGGIAEVYRCDS